MNPFVFVIVNMAVAAFIGGITNYLAIKMLFRPLKPVKVFGRRLPFTPGLIPRRKDEIASSLGRVVSEYLVTSEGLIGALGKEEFKAKIERKLESLVNEWTSKEETIEQLALRWLTPEQYAAAKSRLAGWLRLKTEEGARYLWERYGLSALEFRSLIPGWNEAKRKEWAEWGTGFIVQGLKEHLLSPEGERLLRTVVMQFMNQTGGWIGALAGIFVDEDKVAQKMRLSLAGQLDSPVVRRAVAGFIDRKLEQMSRMKVSDALEKWVRQDALEWSVQHLIELLAAVRWIEELESKRVADLLGGTREKLLEWVPKLAEKCIDLLKENAERAISSINLAQLVEGEVAKFPLERLEQLLLNVSGKEFRAITWLGALLGAIIGLGQSLFVLWTG